MSEQADPKELIGQVENEDLRTQLESVFGALSGSALRQQVEDLKEQNKGLKTNERLRAFKDAGFDPESGPGKALAKLYEGEPDPDKIREVADEYGLNPTASGEAKTDPTAARVAGEDRTAALNAGSVPPRDSSTSDQIAQLDAEGKFAEADRLRAQQLTSS